MSGPKPALNNNEKSTAGALVRPRLQLGVNSRTNQYEKTSGKEGQLRQSLTSNVTKVTPMKTIANYVLHLLERKYLFIPAGGSSFNSSIKRANKKSYY